MCHRDQCEAAPPELLVLLSQMLARDTDFIRLWFRLQVLVQIVEFCVTYRESFYIVQAESFSMFPLVDPRKRKSVILIATSPSGPALGDPGQKQL